MTRRFLLLFGLAVLALGEGRAASRGAKAELPPEISSFISNKEAQACAMAKKLDLKVSTDVWAYFRTAQTGSATEITNAFDRLRQKRLQEKDSTADPGVGTPVF